MSAYEVDNFIYFFFREVATEYINCGKVNICQVYYNITIFNYTSLFFPVYRIIYEADIN